MSGWGGRKGEPRHRGSVAAAAAVEDAQAGRAAFRSGRRSRIMRDINEVTMMLLYSMSRWCDGDKRLKWCVQQMMSDKCFVRSNSRLEWYSELFGV